ncbi:flavodoxin [Enterococcus sp. 669A]|uniref:Flavodoxin n=1 Tax=Candidatus Enterococcus moelleringii TaxID=2815325 RepID=A0ABS3LAJ1_9ENTE|nr:flavodoxin domain-containing protein [Enterococcus sp. 669A]MBO1306639.1 flavodoxin [Enterococcus sp. 669A]
MEKVGVIYGSHYGTTEQYAEWIAESLEAPVFEASKVSKEQLENFELIIFGGGLYASGIKGFKLLKEHSGKNLVLFTVGLADPQVTNYQPVLQHNLSDEQLQHAKIFHLRGGIDYSNLSKMHRIMMTVKKKDVEKKMKLNPNEEDREFMATYNKKVDFLDRQTIAPLLDYVKKELRSDV